MSARCRARSLTSSDITGRSLRLMCANSAPTARHLTALLSKARHYGQMAHPVPKHFDGAVGSKFKAGLEGRL